MKKWMLTLLVVASFASACEKDEKGKEGSTGAATENAAATETDPKNTAVNTASDKANGTAVYTAPGNDAPDDAPPNAPSSLEDSKPAVPPEEQIAPAMIDEKAAKEILANMWVNDGDGKLAAKGTMKQQRDRDKLVHKAFRGTIAVYADAVFLIGDDGKGLPNSPLPFVAVEEDGKWLAHRLPQLPYMNTSVDAVFFEDIGNDGTTDVLVLGKFMTGIGPEGAQEFYSTVGYVWEGDHFTIMDKVGDVAGTAENADKVRAALKAKRLIR